jgi:hypothetical protein
MKSKVQIKIIIIKNNDNKKLIIKIIIIKN